MPLPVFVYALSHVPSGAAYVNCFTAERKRLSSDLTKVRQEVRFRKPRLVLVPLPAILQHIGFLRYPQRGLCPCVRVSILVRKNYSVWGTL